MHPTTLRVGFVPGVEPDRFLRRWKSGRRAAWLELVPVPLSRQAEALAEGEVDMCFVRLPLPPDAREQLHLVGLWEERACVVVGDENVLSLHEDIVETDLAGETEIPATHVDDAAERIAVAATGVGFTRVPLSLARLHHRKDAVSLPLRDGEPTRIALAWPRAADDEIRQEFVGVVRGRTARSSR
jgi:DNA-binding transcriptional LysR family regulator